jgi:protein phosphatase
MNYEFCARTDPGLVRGNNEDAVNFDRPTGLAVLADGMGGYNAGEIASGMATAFITSELSRWLGAAAGHANAREIKRAMEICVANANQSIYRAATTNPQYSGMGTTLVVGIFRGARLVLGHIGDSRCYRLRDGTLVQLTKDHSLLQEQIDAGLITPEQASISANKNLVTRALGVDETVLLEVNEHRVEPDDIYVMCSDGLSDMVDDAIIAKWIGAGLSMDQKAEQLIHAANNGGGRDNISVLLVRAGSPVPAKSIFARLMGR